MVHKIRFTVPVPVAALSDHLPWARCWWWICRVFRRETGAHAANKSDAKGFAELDGRWKEPPRAQSWGQPD